MENDIALLRLQLNVEESQTIQYASIPGPNYVLADNFALTAIGVGRRAVSCSYVYSLGVVTLYLCVEL